MSTRTGNFLENPFLFDHGFFNISPREAKSMDPQQKLLLQGAKIALDDAGYVPDATPSFQRDSIGCYIGVATDDYVQNLIDDIDVYYSPGISHHNTSKTCEEVANNFQALFGLF
jgi:acyl transferase domain-containing protein